MDRLRDEGFADPFTKDAALALFEHGNVLVITNDDDLAWDLLSQRSVKSRYRLHGCCSQLPRLAAQAEGVL